MSKYYKFKLYIKCQKCDFRMHPILIKVRIKENGDNIINIVNYNL